ncbi:MAG: hypothetical protein HN353_02200 [Bdellovibrionales bacterium]|jgi:hypothetical protein|nr:hypothetical protein [Bdellovibrionales bacterium]MBT3525497.1 hypothetical protein [Bdellovibrionales bacterium]MBT7670410.1 hypothetical protein [Bdellovibrionales bacterium]MBT7766752.1 hypothetical protein [Bdellovibrionales bacterium]
MRDAKKIDWKFYLPLSLASTILLGFFCQNLLEIYVLIGVYLVVVINHLLLVKATTRILFTAEGQKTGSTSIVLINLVKLSLLFLALSLGIHFIGDRIIISIINYCFQMVVLAISLK